VELQKLKAKRRSCYCIFYEEQISNRFWMHGNQVNQDQLFETKEGYGLDIHIKKIAHSMQLMTSSKQTEKLKHIPQYKWNKIVCLNWEENWNEYITGCNFMIFHTQHSQNLCEGQHFIDLYWLIVILLK